MLNYEIYHLVMAILENTVATANMNLAIKMKSIFVQMVLTFVV